jgi:hypothetical protein|tara:strand:- start:8914 stop:9846 length:933 start_codon:yes stop_codon:yes gene_type:complete
MAINVDQVYKTVLLIINKEQRGYLTPNEFNKLAAQVQLDILDTYFETINQQLRVPQNESEYGDRYKTVQEKLDVFKKIGNCTFNAAAGTNPAFFTLPTSSGAASGTQLFSTVTNQITYPLTTVTQSQVENSTVVVTYLGVAYTNFTISGGVFSLTAGSLPTGAANNIVITLFPQDFYKLGTILYRDDRIAEPVQRNELALLNMSSLTKPAEQFPVYLFQENKVIIYPQSINSQVQATYIKKPADPSWNFSSATGYYVWDPATSVNFELDITEQVNVIIQILLYAGIVIKDPTIVQAAASEIAQEQQNERN